VGCPLWREVGSVVISCCWASLAQSFSSLSPEGLITIFYCLNFWGFLNLEGQVLVFISPKNKVAQLYPQVQVQVILQPMMSQSVLVLGPHLGHMTRFLILSDIYGRHVMGCPPWREDGSIIYSYNLLSLSGPSPADLMTTSYCVIWDYWVPVLSPLTTRRATVEVF
jgi:hypothetical protein